MLFLDEPTAGLDPAASRDVHEMIEGLRKRGVTVFLTTHRLEEAERLCDRVAILRTRLLTIGSPAHLRTRLSATILTVTTAGPLADPEAVFTGRAGVEGWHAEQAGRYVVAVTDPVRAAPEVTRALVAAGADVLSISPERPTLEDAYLQITGGDDRSKRP